MRGLDTRLRRISPAGFGQCSMKSRAANAEAAAVKAGGNEHENRPAWLKVAVAPVCPHLYAAGSGESDGLAKRLVIIALGGMFRLMPLGGIGLWNHLA